MTKQSSRRRGVAAKQATRSREPAVGLVTAALQSAAADVDEEFDRALVVMAAARRAMLEAEAALRAVLRDSTDDVEQAEAAVELLKVTRELELLENRRTALVNGSATLRPPSQADIAEAQRLAAELGQVIAANGKVAAIVGVTADIIRLTERLMA